MKTIIIYICTFVRSHAINNNLKKNIRTEKVMKAHTLHVSNNIGKYIISV